MKDIIIFLDKEYDKALQICKDFDITKDLYYKAGICN